MGPPIRMKSSFSIWVSIIIFSLLGTSLIHMCSFSVSLTFESRPLAGKRPIARGYHAAVLADSRLFIFGGFNGTDVFDDVQLLDLAGAAYLPQVTSFRIDVE